MTSTEENVAANMHARVCAVLPQIADNARRTEERRWVVDENINLLEEAGLFEMSVPITFGGSQLGLAEQVRVLSAIATACPSTAWACQLWAGNTWMATRFSKRAQDEIFTTPSTRVSAVLAPTGMLTPVPGGYRLTGGWRWNTASRGAHWDGLAARERQPDGSFVVKVAMVPMTDLEMVDDWHPFGAIGTGSGQTRADDVFVPEHRVTAIDDLLAGVRQADVVPRQGWDYGFFSFIVMVSLGAYPGIARGAIDAFLARLPGRGLTYTPWTDQSEHPNTHIKVARAAANVEAAEALMYRMVEVMQDCADRQVQLSIAQRAKIRGVAGHVVRLSREAVETIYSLSGASAIMLDVPVQRFFRDIQALSLHALMESDVNAEVYGRILVGKDPNTPFL